MWASGHKVGAIKKSSCCNSSSFVVLGSGLLAKPFFLSFFPSHAMEKEVCSLLKTVFCFDTALLWYFIVLCLRHKRAEKLFNFLPQNVLQTLYMLQPGSHTHCSNQLLVVQSFSLSMSATWSCPPRVKNQEPSNTQLAVCRATTAAYL